MAKIQTFIKHQYITVKTNKHWKNIPIENEKLRFKLVSTNAQLSLNLFSTKPQFLFCQKLSVSIQLNVECKKLSLSWVCKIVIQWKVDVQLSIKSWMWKLILSSVCKIVTQWQLSTSWVLFPNQVIYFYTLSSILFY